MSKKSVTVLLCLSFFIMLTGFWTEQFFVAWLGWGGLFGILEWYALSRIQKGDTLSEQVWLGTLSKSSGWSIFWRIAIAVFLSWLMAHFLFRFVV